MANEEEGKEGGMSQCRGGVGSAATNRLPSAQGPLFPSRATLNAAGKLEESESIDRIGLAPGLAAATLVPSSDPARIIIASHSHAPPEDEIKNSLMPPPRLKRPSAATMPGLSEMVSMLSSTASSSGKSTSSSSFSSMRTAA